MAEQTSLPWRTFTEVSANTVVAGSSVQTHFLLTVVLVRLAVVSDVAIDTNTLVAPLGVLTGSVVLTGVVVSTLVHVPGTVPVRPVVLALAGVRADTVHTCPSVLAQVAFAVVYILVTVVTGKP